jgi:hypothetical protein
MSNAASLKQLFPEPASIPNERRLAGPVHQRVSLVADKFLADSRKEFDRVNIINTGFIL